MSAWQGYGLSKERSAIFSIKACPHRPDFDEIVLQAKASGFTVEQHDLRTMLQPSNGKSFRRNSTMPKPSAAKAKPAKRKSRALNLTWGYDPEQHLFDNEQGRIVSSILVLRQDKMDPIELGDGIRMYSDNMLCECAAPPCRSTEEATNQLRTVFGRMKERLGPRYRLEAKAAHVYDEDQIVKVENPRIIHPETGKPHVMDPFAFGCDPNYDVYTTSERKVTPPNTGLRTGSFHIHIGDADMATREDSPLDGYRNKALAIRMMDIFVGCASVVMDKDDTTHIRKALYGKAGEFRQTSYGIEYRVLGNWFLRCPQATKAILDMAEHAMEVLRDGLAMDYVRSLSSETIQYAINNNNIPVAKTVLFSAGLPDRLWDAVDHDYTADIANGWGI